MNYSTIKRPLIASDCAPLQMSLIGSADALAAELAELAAEQELNVCPSPQHGLPSNNTARITSDCDALLVHAHQTAVITSEYAPCRIPSSTHVYFLCRG